jgi:hypothetical protein
MTSDDLQEDAERLYEAAKARYDLISAAWVEAGRPLLALGSQGQDVEHPYVGMLRAHERHLPNLAAPLRPKRMGRPPEVALGLGGLKRSPSARLRAVKAPKPS